MPVAARILLSVFGLVVVIYAAASLSGNWLSTPPWWERDVKEIDLRHPIHVGRMNGETYAMFAYGPTAREGRELISVGVGAVGIAALAVAAWPRRKPGSA